MCTGKYLREKIFKYVHINWYCSFFIEINKFLTYHAKVVKILTLKKYLVL